MICSSPICSPSFRRFLLVVCALILLALPLPIFGAFFQPGAQNPQVVTGGLAAPLALSWRYVSAEMINLAPAADGKQIYLPVAAGGVLALNAETGKLVWRENVGGEISAEFTADDTAVFVANQIVAPPSGQLRAQGAIRALGRDSGLTLWMRTIPFPFKGSLVLSDNSLFANAADGRVYSLNKSTGEVRWVVQINGQFSAPPFSYGENLFVGTTDGTLYCLRKNDGKVMWRYRTRGEIRGRATGVNETIFFGGGDGYVYALDQLSGRLRWRSRTGAAIQSVVASGSEVIAASLDNFVYGFTALNGSKLWKRQLAGRPVSQPAVQGDTVLFNPLSGDAGVVLDTRDGKVLNTLPVGEKNNAAASPVISGQTVLLSTREGLIAFAPPK
jgi:eukaryotic-like serine/threonine-protein kinase